MIWLVEVDPLGTIYYNACETGEEGKTLTIADDGADEDQNSVLMVFPNPAIDKLTINYKVEATDEAVFEVYNLMGDKVLAETLNANKNEHTMALSLLNSGVYFYKYNVNGKNTKTGKLVIVK